MSLQLDVVLVFSDGACSGNPGPGGWAYIVADKDQVIEGGGAKSHTTNNQMELQALTNGLKAIKKTDRLIWILSDSVYVLRGATQWAYAWSKRDWKTAEGKDVLNRGDWEELLTVLKRFDRKQLLWGYVPGHKGYPGNERCDEIAVAYSKSENVYLYSGSREDYQYDLEHLPADLSVPEIKYGESSAKKKPFSYLSVVDGIAMRHADWGSCEARVKGRSGVRFKKAMSQDEELSILKEWGIDPARVRE
jgi:ribonuclease HI